jgi:hypothetical protein
VVALFLPTYPLGNAAYQKIMSISAFCVLLVFLAFLVAEEEDLESGVTWTIAMQAN